jgi:predicted lipoprotein with Yx(FWY)xxD motif
MTQIKSKIKTFSAIFLVLTAILTASTGYAFAYSNINAPTQTSPQYTVNIANMPGIGSYLTNGTGWTLYTFARDIPTNATSRCMGMCVRNWPLFYASNLNLPSGLSASSFTVVTRADGGKQLAYYGWPLYYFRNDTKPGDTNGQGFLHVWSVCTYPTPVPEFSTIAIAAFSALAASLYILRRKRHYA